MAGYAFHGPFSVVLSQTASAYLRPLPIGSFIQESLTLFGWVSNWRPTEIFLYDWWPLRRRERLYQGLSAAHVELRAGLGQSARGARGSRPKS